MLPFQYPFTGVLNVSYSTVCHALTQHVAMYRLIGWQMISWSRRRPPPSWGSQSVYMVTWLSGWVIMFLLFIYLLFVIGASPSLVSTLLGRPQARGSEATICACLHAMVHDVSRVFISLQAARGMLLPNGCSVKSLLYEHSLMERIPEGGALTCRQCPLHPAMLRGKKVFWNIGLGFEICT